MSLPRPFKEDRLALPISTSLFQAIDGVMSLALFPLVAPQALYKTRISVLGVPCCTLHPFRVAKVTILKRSGEAVRQIAVTNDGVFYIYFRLFSLVSKLATPTPLPKHTHTKSKNNK